MVMLERTDQARLCLSDSNKAWKRRDGHWHVNKGYARVDMLENGKVNLEERRRSTVARALAP
jgi:hypothetical protein